MFSRVKMINLIGSRDKEDIERYDEQLIPIDRLVYLGEVYIQTEAKLAENLSDELTDR